MGSAGVPAAAVLVSTRPRWAELVLCLEHCNRVGGSGSLGIRVTGRRQCTVKQGGGAHAAADEVTGRCHAPTKSGDLCLKWNTEVGFFRQAKERGLWSVPSRVQTIR